MSTLRTAFLRSLRARGWARPSVAERCYLSAGTLATRHETSQDDNPKEVGGPHSELVA
jgi:hypothetical protein